MIDASIALGVKSPQIEDPMNSYAKLMQMQHAQQQNQLGMMQMDEYKRGVTEKTNFLAARRAAGNDPAAMDRVFADFGRDAELAKLRHEQAQVEGVKAKASKDKSEVENESLGRFRNIATTLDPNNQAAYDAYKELFAAKHPEYAKFLPPVLTPESKTQLLSTSKDVLDQIAARKLEMAPKPLERTDGQKVWYIEGNPNLPTYGQNTAAPVITRKVDPNTSATIGAANERARLDREQRTNQYDPVQYIQTDQGLLAVPKKQQLGVAPTGTRVVGPDGQPLSKPLMAIPAAVQTKIAINNTNLKKAETALALAEGKTVGGLVGDADATGWKGYAPDSLLQRVDEGGIDTRAAIADLGSMIIHERSGAAVTASEFPRLKPFIPTEKDDPPAVRKKLKRFVEIYKEEQKAYREQFSKEAGYGRNEPVSSPQPGVGGVGGVLRFDAQGNPVP